MSSRTPILLVLLHGVQSSLVVCPLHLEGTLFIAAISLMFIWIIYLMSHLISYNDFFLLVNALLELIFVRSGSFSLGGDFADADIRAMITLLCTV